MSKDQGLNPWPLYADFLALPAADARYRSTAEGTYGLLFCDWGLPLDAAEFVCDLVHGGGESTRSLAELCVAFGSPPQMLAVAVQFGLSTIDWSYLHEALDEYFSPTSYNLSLTLDVHQSHGRTEIDVDPFTASALSNLNMAVLAAGQSYGGTRVDVEPLPVAHRTPFNAILADAQQVGDLERWRGLKLQREYRGHWGRYFNAIQEQPRLRADQPFLERLFQLEPKAVMLLNCDACKQLSADQYRNMLAAAIGP